MLTAPIAASAAPNYGHNDRGRIEHNQRTVNRTVVVRKNVYRAPRAWQRGQRFDYRYAPNYRVISNPYRYHLHAAPRGYRWVQSGNDAVLIGVTSGIIASVLAGSIR